MSLYLVTGAAGFIASNVCTILLDQGHHVIGVDNMNDAYDVRLKHWRLERLRKYSAFELHRCNIADMNALRPLFQQSPVAVINLAARAGVRQSVENPWVYVETNISGTVTLLELCRNYGVGKFLLASTSSLYGAKNPRPFREDADTNCVLSPYAASKKGAEAMCHAYHFLYGIDVTIFRYFTVYGPAGRPDMFMFRFVQWIKEGKPLRLNGDGSQSRGVTYLDDIARGTILGLKHLGYETINLGGHQVISLNETIARLEILLGEKARVEYLPSHKADILASQADVTKAHTLLGWQPQVGLDEGMGHLVDWYLAERSWASQVILD